MLSLSVSSKLIFNLLVLALCYHTHTAPTHHLTIGVQGNTPTLIVTSSEIGITPKTFGFPKKSEKINYNAKFSKETIDMPKKSNKTKLNKNQILLHKKETLRLVTKPPTKQTLFKENSFKLAKETFSEILNQTESTTTFLLDNADIDLKLEKPEAGTISPVTTLLPDNDSDIKTFSQISTLPPKPIHKVPTTLYTTPEYNEMSTLPPQFNTDTQATPSLITDKDNLNSSLAMSTSIISKDFEDMTTTINYSEDINTLEALKQTQTQTMVNDVVLQTQKTTQITPDTTVITIPNEYDNDRRTEEPIVVENGTLLFTTINANEFATHTPTLVTLVSDDTEAITTSPLLSSSLTMTTTAENFADDDKNKNNENKQELSATVHIDKGLNGPPKETQKQERYKKIANPTKPEGGKKTISSFLLNPKNGRTLTTTSMQQTSDETKSIENPVKDITVPTYKENKLEIKTITEMKAIVTTQPTNFSATEQQAYAAIKALHEQSVTTNPPDRENEPTATTEAVLKLIDLEKHVIKTIDELKQPSLLMAGQHDSGHDGLKNIKKKQLVDKHYMEALLHSKQEPPKDEEYITQTEQAMEGATTSPPNYYYAAAGRNKTILMPIKHGYLGPIHMEEKTFHVIHHAKNNKTAKSRYSDDVVSQIRKSHFVELKAKAEVTDNRNIEEKLRNRNIKDTLMEKMLSDEPVPYPNKQNLKTTFKNKELGQNIKDIKLVLQKKSKNLKQIITPDINNTFTVASTKEINKQMLDRNNVLLQQSNLMETQTKSVSSINSFKKPDIANLVKKAKADTNTQPAYAGETHKTGPLNNTAVLSTTVFQVIESTATKSPTLQADTLFTSEDKEKAPDENSTKQQTESKISDIQIEVYDSTVDSIVASTNFKDIDSKHQSVLTQSDEMYLGLTTKPPSDSIQQERFTQYIIDRAETSTHEPVNYTTVHVVSGKPEPAAIEIHINVSESFGNVSEDLEFSYPQTEYSGRDNNEKLIEEVYDDSKINDNIKLKIPTNFNGKEPRNDEILVVEILDNDNNVNASLKEKSKTTDELFISDVKDIYTSPPPPPPPPPYQNNFDRDSDTIFYISNTEVKVGESLPTINNSNEERKLKLESQFFPANYMASTHSSINNNEELNPSHHLYEEDIILSPSRNQADSLKIYRNNNEPAPPLDVTYVGESIIEVEQSPESVIITTYAPDQQHNVNVATPQADIVIQPAILPEISIGVPVIGELPPQIELKEIDFMPNEAQLHRSGIYDDNDSSSNGNNIDENTINGSNSKHDVDVVSGNSNSNQHADESSIQYGGDLIDESADGGFDGVEGSYPFGNPAAVGKTPSYSYSSAFLTKLRKQQQQPQHQPNHVADYAHLYVNYGVNNMRKDELSADVKDSGEMVLVSSIGNGNMNVASNEQNITSFKDSLSKVSISNASLPFMSANTTQSERMSNATAFSVMEDLEDKNTEDIINLISLAIGLFIVILPVVVTCSMFWALRYLYKKYHSSLTDNAGYADQIDSKDALNEDCAEKGEFFHAPSSSPTNSYKDTIEKYQNTSNKPSTTDSNFNGSSEKPTSYLETSSSNTNTTIAQTISLNATKKYETLKLSLTLSSPIIQKHAKPPPSASSPLLVATNCEYIHTVHGDVVSEEDDYDDIELPGPNGSITKMTLENNLLIVETEERNDISRVARETKMDYNKDGVFVVEVARGIDSKTIPESPVADGNEKLLSMFDTKQDNGGLGFKITNEKGCINNEKVQIHSPPPENQEDGPRSLHQIEEVDEPMNSPSLFEENKDDIIGLTYKANTGLSQSDLSTTSSNDSNKGYCYGNQELYVVQQKSYSTHSYNGNVVLKSDNKDIKDDDRNPGNDHYLKQSPDKKDGLGEDKQDVVDTYKKLEDTGSRTNSGESPEQRPSEKVQDRNEHDNLRENKEENLEISEKKKTKIDFENRANILNSDLLAKSETPRNLCIPVEIEVHTTPKPSKNSAEESIVRIEPPVSEELANVALPLTEQNLEESVEISAAVDDVRDQDDVLHRELEVITSERVNGTAFVDTLPDDELFQNDVSSIKGTTTQGNNNDDKLETTKGRTVLDIAETTKQELKENQREDKIVTVNSLLVDTETPLPNTVSVKMEDTKATEEGIALNVENEKLEAEVLANCLPISENLMPQPEKQLLQNGHDNAGNSSNSSNDMENGFDSIISLPEPPPITTDDQLNNDLSDQQLDSLPPPPPPEIFNLKDLPPPQTYGNTDSPQSEECNSFYKTLPPPPPTTLEVTERATTATTNGNVHASPLTPPASPPAHFTNNLHAGLCSHPIAVDVNGS